MGWFSSLFAGREIARLEELVGRAPAPSLYLRLSQLYAEQGDKDKARTIAAKGAELFPEHKNLKKTSVSASKGAHAEEKEALKKKIERFPNPTLYSRLAHIYLEDDELDKCLRVCRSAQRNFPSYGGSHLVFAEVAIKKGDHDSALLSLEKAVQLDRHNYAALMLLSEQYLQRERPDEAHGLLERVLEFAPGDEKASDMLKRFDAISAQLAAKGREANLSREVAAPVVAEPTPEPEAALPDDMGTGEAQVSNISEVLDEIKTIEGVQGGLLIDQYGLIIASRIDEGFDEELSAALVSNIQRSIEACSAEIGVGEFEEGNIEGEDGAIHLQTAGELLLVVLSRTDVKLGLLQRAMHTCTEKVADM